MTPETLGPYRVDREIGVGGMGKVYAATLTREAAGLAPGTTVALKVVHPHLLETEGFFRRFLREADIGVSVRHDNVVRTYLADAIAARGQQHNFLVMEYVEGQTLADLQRELDTVPEELCRHVGREICKGLGAIHAAGVVHRDLKPENVLITPDHVVKVMDLGVAKLADEQMRLSQSGAFIGSVEYAAPEQFTGSDVDGRCDLHALGLLLYELSCGQHPYRGDTFAVVMRRVREDTPRRLGEINPQLSAFFEEVVHTLLVKDPRGRFASAAQLLVVLEEGEDSEWWRERALALRAETKRPLRRIRIPRETAVYGREKEIARLRAMFDQAKSGDGQVVLIEGEAGIGKSRLVDELIGRLQSDGEDLNFLFGAYPPTGAAAAACAWSAAFGEHLGGSGCAPYLTEAPLLVPAFEAVLRGDPAPEDAQPLTKGSFATCFVHATRALARERTTVVLIDDLHFAPEDALGFFTSLAMAVPGHRVLLVGTMRPGVSEDWLANLARLDHTTHRTLERLGAKDLTRLLVDAFRSERLAEELAFRIAQKSDGNPFFAFEIIRGLREGQFITQRGDGTWVSTRVIDDIQIPSSVLDLVNARVAQLTDEEHDLLDVAACWGYEFDASLVGAALGISRLPALQRFAKIEKRDRLVRSAGRQFVFDHHQVQEALHRALPEMLREEYHAALADALETRERADEKDPTTLGGALLVDLSRHFLRGAQGQCALRYLDGALDHLLLNYLARDAIDLCEFVLREPAESDWLDAASRVRILQQLSRALAQWGGRSEQLRVLSDLLELAIELRDDVATRQALLRRGQTRWMSDGATAEAAADLERARDLAEEAGDVEVAAAARGVLAGIAHAQGRAAEALAVYRENTRLFEARGNLSWAATALNKAATVFVERGEFLEAQAHGEHALALARKAGVRELEAGSTGKLGTISQSQRRLADAQEHHQRCLALSREIGDRAGEAIAICCLGNTFADQGRLPQAREHLERFLALSRELGNRLGEAIAHFNLGGTSGEAGENDRAEEHLRTCLALCDETANRRLAARAHLALGALRTEANAGAEARAPLEAASDLAARHGLSGIAVMARCHLALLPGGSLEDAQAVLAQLEDRLTVTERTKAHLLLWKAGGDPTQLVAAKRLLDELLSRNPIEYHESMLTNLRVNREILAAWREEFGDPAGPGESETRVG